MMTPKTAPKLALLALLALAACGDDAQVVDYQTYVAQQGDLRISISQKGTIEARDPVSVTNPIEGSSVLLGIVPEGTFVKKGDKLFSLDVSDQQDRILQQQISTSSAEQSLFSAQQQLEITKQQNESDVKRAELDVLFAELDLKQYIEGDLPREQDGVNAEITLAREEAERAKETVTWSEKLAERGFISADKLKADRLTVKRREIEENLAIQKLNVLDNYTAKKKKRELESKLEESKRELVRVNARCEAALSQRLIDVESRSAQHELEKKKLQRLEEQIANNSVYSPRDGIVIYAREGGRRDSRPIEEGANVRKGQVIVEIPDMDQVLVDVDIHESSVHMVDLGMPVLVTTDTGESIQGVVESVATIADSQSWYRNPDLKVYSTKVTIPNTGNKLKPGMNCYAEVVIKNLSNVVSIPVQAVYDNGRQTFCYVQKDGKPELRKIEVGLHNNEKIHVKSGLMADERVYLAVPPDAPSVPKMAMTDEPILVHDSSAEVASESESEPKKSAIPAKSDDQPEGSSRRGKRGEGISEEMRKKFEGMTPEQRKAEFEKMRGQKTPEQSE